MARRNARAVTGFQPREARTFGSGIGLRDGNGKRPFNPLSAFNLSCISEHGHGKIHTRRVVAVCSLPPIGSNPTDTSESKEWTIVASTRRSCLFLFEAASLSASESEPLGPIARVSKPGPVTHGGSARVSVVGESDFTRVFVSTPMADGCWDVSLPSGVTVEDLVLGLNPELRSGRLKVRFTLEGPSGVGGASEEEIDVGS